MDRELYPYGYSDELFYFVVVYSNYTLESSVFSVVLGNLVIPDDVDSVVEFNITHRTVGY